MASEYPLSLIIKAVDKATAPIRAINKRMAEITKPVRQVANSFRALADEAGLPRLTKSVLGAGKAVAGVGREAIALGTKLAGLAAAAGFGLYSIVRGAVDAGDKLNEMAQRVGLTVDAYAQLQFAAAQADVEQEAFNGAMDQFNKRLGEAKAGGGGLLTFLQQVAPGLALQVKSAKTTEEALDLMIGAFERVQDPGKRAALAAAAFGKSGLQMGQFLGQGSKAIADQRKRFLELMGSQAEFAAGANDLDNAMRETESAFLGLRSAAAGALFPALTELAKAITSVVSGKRGELAGWAREAGAAISAWVARGGVKDVVVALRDFGAVAGRVIDAVGGLKGVAILFATYLSSGFIGSLLGAGKALWSLGAALVAVLPAVWAFTAALLANPITWIVAGIAALVALGVAMYRNWEPTARLFERIWESLQKISFRRTTSSGPLTGYGPDDQDFGAGSALGAAKALPAVGVQQAHVTVDFNNAPRGLRVQQAHDSTASLDLSVGYSMAASH